jgi:hypothetical protein
MAKEATIRTKCDPLDTVISIDTNQGVHTMTSFVIKCHAEGLIMTAECLGMNEGIFTK